MTRLLSREQLTLPDGSSVPASAPFIISASRATDIPAFHLSWLLNRIKDGFAARINPHSGRPYFISFYRCKGIVFWSKNPAPLLPHFSRIIDRFPGSYLQFTLNDYDRERLEPDVPPLRERLRTLEALSRSIGSERIMWRFDPILVSSTLNLETVLNRLESLAGIIAPLAAGLAFSFLDFDRYASVRSRLRHRQDLFSGPAERYRITQAMKAEAAERICSIIKSVRVHNPGFSAATCAETVSFTQSVIAPAACVDAARVAALAGMSDLFGTPSDIERKKDPGQRPECRCDLSRDIGAYGTCPHHCLYCYARGSAHIAQSPSDGAGWTLGGSKNT
jgi:hypothetical protein